MRRRAREAGVRGMKPGRERVYKLSEVEKIDAILAERSGPLPSSAMARMPDADHSATAERVGEILHKIRRGEKTKESRRLGKKVRLAPRPQGTSQGNVIALGLSKKTV